MKPCWLLCMILQHIQLPTVHNGAAGQPTDLTQALMYKHVLLAAWPLPTRAPDVHLSIFQQEVTAACQHGLASSARAHCLSCLEQLLLQQLSSLLAPATSCAGAVPDWPAAVFEAQQQRPQQVRHMRGHCRPVHLVHQLCDHCTGRLTHSMVAGLGLADIVEHNLVEPPQASQGGHDGHIAAATSCRAVTAARQWQSSLISPQSLQSWNPSICWLQRTRWQPDQHTPQSYAAACCLAMMKLCFCSLWSHIIIHLVTSKNQKLYDFVLGNFMGGQSSHGTIFPLPD